jgi:hypothetical protein
MARRKELTKAQDAMLEHFAYLNFSENRPACWKDFLLFEVNSKQYRLKHGTIRNHFSYLKQLGRIKLEYRDISAYYSLAEASMTPYQAPVIISSQQQKPHTTYKKGADFLASLLARTPFGEITIHDVHLSFQCPTLWERLVPASKTSTAPICKDLILQPISLVKEYGITAKPVVHRTGTVVIRLACSKNPIPLTAEGLITINSSLAFIRGKLLSFVVDNSNDDGDSVEIPDHFDWIFKMWHKGRDSLERYTGQRFEFTVRDLNNEVLRTYSKEKRSGYNILRTERQEYPDITVRELATELLGGSGGGSSSLK